MLNIEELENFIIIRELNYMDKRLPKCYEIQNSINKLLDLSGTFNGTGLYLLTLDREVLLKLNLAILNRIEQGKENASN